MSDYPVQFVHVGMGKCASTFLQSIWTYDEAYTPVLATDLRQACRDMAVDQTLTEIPVATRPSPDLNGLVQVASDEGFTFSFATDTANQDRIERLYEVSAHVLGKSMMTDTVFIMVRDPISWISSVYGQSIKEGNFRSYEQFFKDQNVFIRQSLNMAKIITTFAEQFPRVVVLPLEMLKDDSNQFWQLYASELKAPIPNEDTLDLARQTANEQFSDEKLFYQYQHNIIMNRLRGYTHLLTPDLFGGEDHKDKIDLQFHNYHFYSRMIMEQLDDGQAKALMDGVKLGKRSDVTERFIDPSMQDFLLTHMIEPLKITGLLPNHYIQSYTESVMAAELKI